MVDEIGVYVRVFCQDFILDCACSCPAECPLGTTVFAVWEEEEGPVSGAGPVVAAGCVD